MGAHFNEHALVRLNVYLQFACLVERAVQQIQEKLVANVWSGVHRVPPQLLVQRQVIITVQKLITLHTKNVYATLQLAAPSALCEGRHTMRQGRTRFDFTVSSDACSNTTINLLSFVVSFKVRGNRGGARSSGISAMTSTEIRDSPACFVWRSRSVAKRSNQSAPKYALLAPGRLIFIRQLPQQPRPSAPSLR